MKSKKVLVICLIAVLSLALMGFGFAKWTDKVSFEGTVATGDIGVKIQGQSTNDNGADPQVLPGKNLEGKDVASCSMCTTRDGKTIKLNIDKAYPWYAPEFTFRITSTGTVPVKVESVTNTNWSGKLGSFIALDSWQIHVVNPASNGLKKVNKTITSKSGKATWANLAENLKYIQLHKGGYIDVKVCLYIKEEVKTGGCCGGSTEIAPQNANSSATIDFNFAQWNEVYKSGHGTSGFEPFSDEVEIFDM